MALIIRLIPKIGVLKILSVKAPTPITEELFIESVNDSADTLRDLSGAFQTVKCLARCSRIAISTRDGE